MMKNIILIALMIFTNICSAQFIEKQQALEDLNEFKDLLKVQSSYFQLTDSDFDSFFEETRAEIYIYDSFPIYKLAYAFERILSETIDRHASVKMEDFDEDDIEVFDLHFPFAIAPLNGKAVALTRNKATRNYEYYAKEYPYQWSVEVSRPFCSPEAEINDFRPDPLD